MSQAGSLIIAGGGRGGGDDGVRRDGVVTVVGGMEGLEANLGPILGMVWR